jgi:hypothetical protein
MRPEIPNIREKEEQSSEGRTVEQMVVTRMRACGGVGNRASVRFATTTKRSMVSKGKAWRGAREGSGRP